MDLIRCDVVSTQAAIMNGLNRCALPGQWVRAAASREEDRRLQRRMRAMNIALTGRGLPDSGPPVSARPGLRAVLSSGRPTSPAPSSEWGQNAFQSGGEELSVRPPASLL